MNIVMMTNNYKPFVGGVPISIERLAGGLAALGHQVFIFAPAYGDGPEIEHPASGVTIYRFRSTRGKSINQYVAGGMAIGHGTDRRIDRWLRECQPDVIHVHHPFLIGSTALRMGKKYHIPVCFTYHTRYEQYLSYLKPLAKLEQAAGKARWSPLRTPAQKAVRCAKERVIPAYVRAYANRCQMVFAPTPSMEQYLGAHGVTAPIRRLPTGLDGSSFSPDSQQTVRIRELYAGDCPYLLCTVSRLAAEKNLLFFLRGLAELKQRIGPRFRCLLIGDGPQRRELEEAAAKMGLGAQVLFLGCIPNEELVAYHAACDLFLFSSRTETQGIVLLEAMAAGTPVVAVEATGASDVMENGVNGIQTPHDETAWAQAAAELLQDPDRREDLSRAARQTAQAYQSQAIAQRAVIHYQAVCDQFGRNTR